MPSVGSASSNSSFDTSGAPASYTDDGPPDSTSAEGRIMRICSSGMLNGWISQYTLSSRLRRAISCVYCDPKSRMRTISRFTDTVSPRSGGALVLGEHRADAVGEQTHQRRQLAG